MRHGFARGESVVGGPEMLEARLAFASAAIQPQPSQAVAPDRRVALLGWLAPAIGHQEQLG